MILSSRRPFVLPFLLMILSCRRQDELPYFIVVFMPKTSHITFSNCLTIAGGKNMQCDKSSRNLWLPINREAFPIRYFYSKPREGFDNTNYSSCRDGCNEHGICSVVIGESTCQWYEQSYTYSYSMSHDTSLVFVQIKMCPAGKTYFTALKLLVFPSFKCIPFCAFVCFVNAF